MELCGFLPKAATPRIAPIMLDNQFHWDGGEKAALKQHRLRKQLNQFYRSLKARATAMLKRIPALKPHHLASR